MNYTNIITYLFNTSCLLNHNASNILEMNPSIKSYAGITMFNINLTDEYIYPLESYDFNDCILDLDYEYLFNIDD